MTSTPSMMTVKGIAQLLDISVQAARQRIHASGIQTVTSGRKILVSIDDIQKLKSRPTKPKYESLSSATQAQQLRSEVGAARRTKDPERERIARRDLAAAKLEAYIAKTVAAAPPLTPNQAARIAGLLGVTPAHGSAD